MNQNAGMKNTNRRQWHDECVKGKYKFSMQRELLEYCKNYVDILASAVVKFSNIYEERSDGLQCI